MKVERKNKNYSKRKLKIVDDNDKLLCYVEPCFGWFSYSNAMRNNKELRPLIIENLYWLLGRDCDFEEWTDSIEKWDRGKRIYGVPIDKLPESQFFSKEEKEKALNSFYNV